MSHCTAATNGVARQNTLKSTRISTDRTDVNVPTPLRGGVGGAAPLETKNYLDTGNEPPARPQFWPPELPIDIYNTLGDETTHPPLEEGGYTTSENTAKIDQRDVLQVCPKHLAWGFWNGLPTKLGQRLQIEWITQQTGRLCQCPDCRTGARLRLTRIGTPTPKQRPKKGLDRR